jgi:DNA-binding IclR family transcriptional regulator
MPTAEKRFEYRIQVIDRAFQILDVLGAGGEMGVAELSRQLGMHKSTTHRLVMVLESSRFLERDANGKCRLGHRVMQLGLSALSRLDICDVARPHLRRLVAATGETAHIGVLRDGEVTSIVNVQSAQSLRSPSTVGTRTPAYCTSLGKVIIAFSPEDQISELIRQCTFQRHTGNTITSADRFLKEIDAIRRRGYAVDDEEWEEGLRCMSAAVRDSCGEVMAAVSIAGPIFRMTTANLAKYSVNVKETAAAISASLGFAKRVDHGTENRRTDNR